MEQEHYWVRLVLWPEARFSPPLHRSTLVSPAGDWEGGAENPLQPRHFSLMNVGEVSARRRRCGVNTADHQAPVPSPTVPVTEVSINKTISPRLWSWTSWATAESCLYRCLQRKETWFNQDVLVSFPCTSCPQRVWLQLDSVVQVSIRVFKVHRRRFPESTESSGNRSSGPTDLIKRLSSF